MPSLLKGSGRKTYWLLLPRLEEQVCRGVPHKAVASPQFLDRLLGRARDAVLSVTLFGFVTVGEEMVPY